MTGERGDGWLREHRARAMHERVVRAQLDRLQGDHLDGELGARDVPATDTVLLRSEIRWRHAHLLVVVETRREGKSYRTQTFLLRAATPRPLPRVG